MRRAQADRFTGNLPGTDTFRQMRQHYVAFFVQDDWRAVERPELNYGLRYEFVTDPKELDGQVAGPAQLRRPRDRRRSASRPGTPMFKNPSKKSFAPRLGVGVESVRRQEDDGQGRLRASSISR